MPRRFRFWTDGFKGGGEEVYIMYLFFYFWDGKIKGLKVWTFHILTEVFLQTTESLFKTLGTSIIYSPMHTPFLDQSRLLKIHVTFV